VLGLRHSGKRVFFFKKRQISSPSAWAAALGEEGFFLKRQKSFPSVALGEEKHSGKKIIKKENGVGRRRQIFPEC
jgi:hypothetical protein